MKAVVTAKQMRMLEEYAMQKLEIPPIVLMERASCAVAKCILEKWNNQKEKKTSKTKGRILVLCGNGNNGADGYALARILYEAGCRVTTLDCLGNKRRSELNQFQRKILEKLSQETDAIKMFSFSLNENGTTFLKHEYDVIVDAILGIGVNRPLSDELISLVTWANEQTGLKVALDQPTGIDTDTGSLLGAAFKADITVTFGAKKVGQLLKEGKLSCGIVLVDTCAMYYANDCDILQYPPVSLEGEMSQFELEHADLGLFLSRNPLGNKGSFGKIGIIAGSREIGGAAILCTRAAFAAGAGYIKLLTHENNRIPVLERVPEVVLSVFTDEGKADLTSLFSFSKVIVIGPGIGTQWQAKQRFMELLSLYERLSEKERRKKPLVVDADALNMLSDDDDLSQSLFSLGLTVIMTPHLLEFSRLCKKTLSKITANRVQIAREYAMRHQVILVLKDAQTIIASPLGQVCINTTGNDGMAVAGSGDTLCGILASLLGLQKDPFLSACAGVYIHGAAGDIACKKKGAHGMLPSDLIDAMKEVLDS